MTRVGTVAQIWRHPVKSMQGEQVDTAVISEVGLEGDRRWGVFHLDAGKVISAKREGRLLEARASLPDPDVPPTVTLPDRREFVASDPALDEALTEWLGYDAAVRSAPEGATPWEFSMSELYPADMEADGVPEELVELDTPAGNFYDLAGAHLLTTSSLAAAAAEHPDGTWDVRRFRPQLVIDTGGVPGFLENAWVGSLVRAGGAVFSGFMPTVRCVVPTRSQPGVDRDIDIWKTLKRVNGFNLGLYANVAEAGTVAVGDPVEVSSA